MKNAVISFSGGMDSTALLLWFYSRDYNCHAISFDYGQKHAVELERAEQNIAYIEQQCGRKITHRKIDITSIMGLLDSALTTRDFDVPHGFYEADNMKDTVVPNRNGIFASIVFGYAVSLRNKINERVSVGLGVHSGDHEIYPDCRPNFFNTLFHAFQIGNWSGEDIKLEIPYADMDKTGILGFAETDIQHLGLDFITVFKNTNTSYDPDENGVPSGKSGSDIERILAFHEYGKPDPLDYGKPWSEVVAHALKVQDEFKAAS